MSLTDAQVKELADALWDAEQTHNYVSPLTERYADISAEDAYRVQQVVLDRKLAGGKRIVGKKVGLTSAAMQQMLGIDQPDYGMIFEDMVFEDGVELSVSALHQPRVEPEITFYLKSTLRGPGVSVDDVLEATDYVVASLEVVGSRIADWKIKLADTIADNASHMAAVVGKQRIQVGGLDLVNEGLVFQKNGEELSRGTGAAVLGNPANAVAWCANKLGEYGVSLNEGELVMPGALVGMTPVQAGDTITATFDNVGVVSAQFVD